MIWKQRKIVAGIVAGLVLTAGGFGVLSAQSQDKAAVQPRYCMTQGERPDGQPPRMTTDEVAKHIAASFGVDEKQVKSALDDNKDFRDIGQAAMLAKISGKSFEDVLALKTDDKDWRDRIQENEDVESVSANSIEELIKKIQDVTYASMSDNVMTEAELAVGGHIDFKG